MGRSVREGTDTYTKVEGESAKVRLTIKWWKGKYFNLARTHCGNLIWLRQSNFSKYPGYSTRNPVPQNWYTELIQNGYHLKAYGNAYPTSWHMIDVVPEQYNKIGIFVPDFFEKRPIMGY